MRLYGTGSPSIPDSGLRAGVGSRGELASGVGSASGDWIPDGGAASPHDGDRGAEGVSPVPPGGAEGASRAAHPR
ncbi:MAG TPA: hypothetical protein VIM84_06345, partial [Gemmatimonadales bacterium]